MKSILDKSFRYVSSHATDIRKTFDAAKAKLEEEKKRSEEIIKEAEAVVARTRIKGKVA